MSNRAELIIPELMDFAWQCQPFMTPQRRNPNSKSEDPRTPTGSEFGNSDLVHPRQQLGASTSYQSLDDIAELFRMFQTFDRNQDGLICKQDIAQIMMKLDNQLLDKDIAAILESVDEDRDGCIDFHEFCSIFTSLEESEGSEQDEPDEEEEDESLLDAFRIFDKNHDGYITTEELHIVLSSLGFPGCGKVVDCDRMIKNVDCNGDGQIDFLEFKNMMCNGAPLKTAIVVQ